MWVDKYKAYLDVKCAECGKEVDAMLVPIPVGSNNQTIDVTPCECQTPDPEEKLSEAIDEVQTANADSEECVACGAMPDGARGT